MSLLLALFNCFNHLNELDVDKYMKVKLNCLDKKQQK